MSNQRPLPSTLANSRVNGAIAAIVSPRSFSCFCSTAEHLGQLVAGPA